MTGLELKTKVLNDYTDNRFSKENLIEKGISLVDIIHAGPAMYWNEKDGKDEISAIKIIIKYEEKEYYIHIYCGIGARNNSLEASIVGSDFDIELSDYPTKIYFYQRDNQKDNLSELPKVIEDFIAELRFDMITDEDSYFNNDSDFFHGLTSMFNEQDKNFEKNVNHVIDMVIDKEKPDEKKFNELERIYFEIKKTLDAQRKTDISVEEFKELLEKCDMISIDNIMIPIKDVFRDADCLLKAEWIKDNSDYDISINCADVDKILKVEDYYLINDIFKISLLKINKL